MRVIRLFLIAALMAMLGGCASMEMETVTETELDAMGAPPAQTGTEKNSFKVGTAAEVAATKEATAKQTANQKPKTIKVTRTIKGPVEGIAAIQHATVARQVVQVLPQLVSKVTIPGGYDKDGNKRGDITLALVDSAAYTVAKVAMNFSGYESPTIKAAKLGLKAIGKLSPWFALWAVTDTLSNNMGNKEYNFANSFNNNKGSPVSMFNGHASAQTATANINEDQSSHDDHSTHDDHTDNSNDESD